MFYTLTELYTLPLAYILIKLYFLFSGIAMLFSAGTFLYVATVHVLPELTHPHSHTHALLPAADGVPPKRARSGLLPSEVLVLTVGAMLPVLLTLSHKH